MNTKLILIAGLATGLALQVCPTAMAQITQTYSSGTLNQIIPDGDLSGVASTINVAAEPGINRITGIDVTLDIAGIPNAGDAYNGDYYAYLQFGSGLVVLLNHIDTPPVYGSPGSGFSITLSDGNPDVGTAPYLAGQPLTGTYAPQGGSLDGTFAGMAPDGAWTLFIADTSGGGVGQLTDWSLSVTGVPDNGSSLLLMAMGLGLLGLYGVRAPRAAVVVHRK